MDVTFFTQEIQMLGASITEDGMGSDSGLPQDGDITATLFFIFDAAKIPLPLHIDILENWWNEEEQFYFTYIGDVRISLSTNLHILRAYLSSSDTSKAKKMKIFQRVVPIFTRPEYLNFSNWVDKWHLSPLYSIGDLIAILSNFASEYPEIPEENFQRTKAGYRDSVTFQKGCQWVYFRVPSQQYLQEPKLQMHINLHRPRLLQCDLKPLALRQGGRSYPPSLERVAGEIRANKPFLILQFINKT